MEFIADIEELRKLKRMTKREIASIVDITPEYYSKIVHSGADLSASLLFKLVQAVGGKLFFTLDRSKYDILAKK